MSIETIAQFIAMITFNSLQLSPESIFPYGRAVVQGVGQVPHPVVLFAQPFHLLQYHARILARSNPALWSLFQIGNLFLCLTQLSAQAVDLFLETLGSTMLIPVYVLEIYFVVVPHWLLSLVRKRARWDAVESVVAADLL